MKEFYRDTFSILNYQGSKKNLLDFIYNNVVDYIDDKKAVFDIFCGTCSVSYSMKRYFKIYANDSELFASVIGKALIEDNIQNLKLQEIIDEFNVYYYKNYSLLEEKYKFYIKEEQRYLKQLDYERLIKLYETYPCIWADIDFDYYNGKVKTIFDLQRLKDRIPYMLFVTYYANTYFGVKQALEIDSIRFAISKLSKKYSNILLSSLYYAMKECVFSKDGHMAQPLDIRKNRSKLISRRQKSIYENFMKKLSEFFSDKFVHSNRKNEVFNQEFSQIIKHSNIKKKVGFIYADPPYTDMQYSRYYHLLNTVTLYDYDNISYNKGKLSKGLYRQQRFQSPLSQKSKAKKETLKLFEFCKNNKINLGFSFAYPRDPKNQPTNRYTMDISTIIDIANNTYGKNNVKVVTEEYKHSNNRNSKSKKVLEYLIVCKY